MADLLVFARCYRVLQRAAQRFGLCGQIRLAATILVERGELLA
jgi:hypothetical protein